MTRTVGLLGSNAMTKGQQKAYGAILVIVQKAVEVRGRGVCGESEVP